MGNQFLVNSYQRNWQDEPDVLALPDGGFLITWDSFYNNYDDGPAAYVVAGQRYDAGGSRVGGEFLINGIDGAASTTPAVALLRDGGYAVAWSYSPDGILGQTRSFVQAFDADGTARFAPQRVDTVTLFESDRPQPVATSGGGFLVTYTARQSDSNFDDVYYRVYDADGTAQGAERLLNVREDFLDQGIVETARLAGNRVVAIWNSESTLDTAADVDSNELRATIFDAAGRPVRADFHLAPNFGAAGGGNGQGFDVAAAPGGGFVISQEEYGFKLGFEDSSDEAFLLIQAFNANGQRTTGRVIAHRTDEVIYGTDVAVLETGEIVVVWEQQPEPRGEVGNDVMARVFTAAGRPLSAAFEVGQLDAEYLKQTDPVVEALRGGGFVVAFADEAVDSDDDGVAARVFGRGTDGADRLRVDASGTLAGGRGDDQLTGDGRANGLNGGGGDDVLRGGGGNDVLTGGSGRDRLLGGSGADDFVFERRPGGAWGPDRIAGWDRADEIVLDGGAFGGIGGGGDLPGRAFRTLGEGRVDGNDRILYDPRSGEVYYDANGSGGGGRRLLVDVGGGPRLTADDFAVA